MESNTLKGRVFSQTTTGVKNENGMWTLEVVMVEKVTMPDGQVFEESIETMCMDEDFDTAHQTALRAALTELQELVYSRGFDSLIEGKEYQRKLEEKNDLIETNKDSSTKQYSN